MINPLADPEFALLAAATARPATSQHVATIAAVGDGQQIDWRRFLDLVEHHRVAPLAFDGLTGVRDSIPEIVERDLRAAAFRDRTGALQLAGVLARVTARLAEDGIEAVSVKGPTLAILAFGDASIRQSRDLDLLIAPDALMRALAALETIGCQTVSPEGFDDPEQLRLWSGLMKDMTLRHAPSGAIIELHWRLSNNTYLLPSSFGRSRQSVALGNAPTATLGPDELMLYLCVHGARHSWFRLKWLADVNAMFARSGVEEMIAFRERAIACGLRIPADQMLLLLDAVYGLVLPPEVRATAGRSRRTRSVTRAALRYLLMSEELDTRRFETYTMTFNRFQLRREPRYLAREMLELIVDWPTLLRLGGSRGAYVAATIGRPMFFLMRRAGLWRDKQAR